MALVSEPHGHSHITQPCIVYGESQRHKPSPSLPLSSSVPSINSELIVILENKGGAELLLHFLLKFCCFFKRKCKFSRKMFSFLLYRFVSNPTFFLESQNVQSSPFYNNNKSREKSTFCLSGVGFCWKKTCGNFESSVKHMHVVSTWHSFWLTPVGFSIKGRIQLTCRHLQQVREIFSQKANQTSRESLELKTSRTLHFTNASQKSLILYLTGS